MIHFVYKLPLPLHIPQIMLMKELLLTGFFNSSILLPRLVGSSLYFRCLLSAAALTSARAFLTSLGMPCAAFTYTPLTLSTAFTLPSRCSHALRTDFVDSFAAGVHSSGLFLADE